MHCVLRVAFVDLERPDGGGCNTPLDAPAQPRFADGDNVFRRRQTPPDNENIITTACPVRIQREAGICGPHAENPAGGRATPQSAPIPAFHLGSLALPVVSARLFAPCCEPMCASVNGSLEEG